MKRFLMTLLTLAPVGCTSNADVSKLVKVIYKMDQKIDVVDGKVEAMDSRVTALEGGRPPSRPSYRPSYTPTIQPVSDPGVEQCRVPAADGSDENGAGELHGDHYPE